MGSHRLNILAAALLVASFVCVVAGIWLISWQWWVTGTLCLIVAAGIKGTLEKKQ